MALTFDEAELMQRVDNDKAFLAETVAMLTSDGPALVADLRRAMAAGDAGQVGRIAHALKGMISNFCAPRAQQSALDVERIGKAGDLSSAAPAVRALEEHLDALTGELLVFIKAGS